MNDLLLTTMVDKLNTINEKVVQISNAAQSPSDGEEIRKLTAQVAEVKTAISCLPDLIKFPVVTMDKLVRELEQNNHLTKHPPAKEVRHHHHITPPIIICGVLFLALVLSAVWLYNSRAALGEYRAGDFKYRYTKMQAGKELRKYIASTDSLYKADPPAFQDMVLKWEEEKERLAALLLEAQQKEQEATELRQKAGKLK